MMFLLVKCSRRKKMTTTMRMPFTRRMAGLGLTTRDFAFAGTVVGGAWYLSRMFKKMDTKFEAMDTKFDAKFQRLEAQFQAMIASQLGLQQLIEARLPATLTAQGGLP